MAFSAGTLTRIQGSELAKGKAGENVGLRKHKGGKEYVYFSVKSATTGEHMGYMVFTKEVIAAEGADPATITVA
ncbi:MAG: hypothetical protein ABIK28_25680 [Planctomycetota bacterium]